MNSKKTPQLTPCSVISVCVKYGYCCSRWCCPFSLWFETSVVVCSDDHSPFFLNLSPPQPMDRRAWRVKFLHPLQRSILCSCFRSINFTLIASRFVVGGTPPTFSTIISTSHPLPLFAVAFPPFAVRENSGAGLKSMSTQKSIWYGCKRARVCVCVSNSAAHRPRVGSGKSAKCAIYGPFPGLCPQFYPFSRQQRTPENSKKRDELLRSNDFELL